MKQQKRIIAFVDKWIGLECLDSMVKQFPDDRYTIMFGKNVPVEKWEEWQTHDTRGISPESIAELRSMPAESFDWLLNLWGHELFREADIRLAKKTLNIHPGILPVMRGSDPVVWTIRKRSEAGATLHELTLDIDAGPIWTQVTTPYKLPIKGGELYDRVVRDCITMFRARWPEIRGTSMSGAKQTGEHHTNKRKQLEPDRRIPYDETISKLLAHDFNEGYRAIVEIDGVDYHAQLTLTKIEK